MPLPRAGDVADRHPPDRADGARRAGLEAPVLVDAAVDEPARADDGAVRASATAWSARGVELVALELDRHALADDEDLVAQRVDGVEVRRRREAHARLTARLRARTGTRTR